MAAARTPTSKFPRIGRRLDLADLRILAVTGGAELYGSDRVLHEAVAALVGRGHRVIVASGTTGPLLSHLESAGVCTVLQPSPVLRRTYLTPRGLLEFAGVVARTMPAMIRLTRRLRPDVIYANTSTLPAWSIVGRLTATPVLVHVHEAESGQAAPLRKVLATALRAATALIFNSETSRQLAVSDAFGDLPSSTVILNPVPTPSRVKPLRQSLNEPVRLLFVGRISARKGADVAIEALAALLADGVDATLDLVGDVFPGYEDFAERVHQRAMAPELAGRVTLHGFQADVAPFHAQADIALVPSRADESFGNVLIEAALAGRPVIAASQTGLLEAANGLRSVSFVAPGEPLQVAASVKDLSTRWAEVRGHASVSALTAQARHDPAAFGEHITAAVSGTVRAGPRHGSSTSRWRHRRVGRRRQGVQHEAGG